MAKTLLNAVSEVLKRNGMITSDAGALSTLTNSALQRDIDVCVQVVNEGIVDLFSASEKSLASGQAESSFTLVAGTQAYELASDLVQLRWPLIDKTNNQYLTEFPGGYNAILLHDPEQDDTGLPHWAAIRPTDGKLYLDRAPTSEEAGRIYTYQYDKSLLISTAAATMPFTDEVFTKMVPAWSRRWHKARRGGEFDEKEYKKDVGAAALLLTRQQPRTSYSPR